MTDKQIYLTAIDRFGRHTQTDKSIEEMSELTKALLKYRADPTRENLESVREEMADVEIMLKQLKLLYGNYDTWLEHKLRRLQARLGFKE